MFREMQLYKTIVWKVKLIILAPGDFDVPRKKIALVY
jgi:hypothetical protein